MLKFDFSDFDRAAKKLGLAIDQLPFAISKAMNASAFATRASMISDWPGQVDAKNANFARASLRVVPSKKSNLEVEINDSGTGGRSLMGELDQGGTKTARSGELAVPTRNVRQGPRGAVPSQRPRALKVAIRRGDAIYEIVGKGKRRRLKLMYIIKPSVAIPAQVPLHEEFARSMKQEMETRVSKAMMDALESAFKK